MNSKELELIGFSSNTLLAKKSLSGTRGFLCNHLNTRGVVSTIHDVDISKWEKYTIFIKSMSLNRNKWLFKDRISIEKAALKSKNAGQIIERSIGSKFNVCLQIGSDFQLHHIDALKMIPKFSYHDNNILAFLRSNHGLPLKELQNPIRKIINFEKNIYDNLDGIFTMSDFLRNSFINDFGIPEDKVHTIGFGCNLPIIKNFNKVYNSNIILFVAKDSFHQKGGGDLMKAFGILKEKIPDLKLIVVGQKIRTSDKNILCTGFIDKSTPAGEEQILNLYKEATLFVMPSYVEAAGNVFLEAMACKLPCIGADLSAMPEIICGNNCGFVAKPGDANDLAEKILCILQNKELQIKFGENGFKAIQNKYNWDVVCEKAIRVMGSHLK